MLYVKETVPPAHKRGADVSLLFNDAVASHPSFTVTNCAIQALYAAVAAA